MRRFMKRRFVGVAVGLVVVVAIAGVAFAYWTAGGGGTGTGSTSAGSTPVVVVQTSTLNAMYPGRAPQTLSGNFNNPNTYGVYVTQVSVVVTSTSNAGCTAADFTITGSPMPVGVVIPAGTSVGAWGGAQISFYDNPGRNQDACKGVTVNLTYTAS